MAALQTNSLQRKASGRSAKSNWTNNDGHTEGNLNCVAIRHGWTRTFSLAPHEVSILDYAGLETILQLPTLKLRAMNTRIYVEHPPGSGAWSKVRFWKDDHSLQSVLVQKFFQDRLSEGAVTTFDVRDGSERDDMLSIRSGVTGRSGVARVVPGVGQTREWLKRRGNGRASAQTDVDEDGANTEPGADAEDKTKPKPPKGSRMQALKFLIGLSSQPPAPPPKTQEQIEQEIINEEEIMKKRGWLPPGVRRLQSLRSKGNSSAVRLGNNLFGNSSERDFFNRRRRKARPASDDGPHEDPFAGDGEEINMSDAETEREHPQQLRGADIHSIQRADIHSIHEGEEDAKELPAAPDGASGAEQKRWFGLFGAAGPKTPDGKSPTPHSEAARSKASVADNPFVGEPERERPEKGKKGKKKDKGKNKATELPGAERIRVPSDALEPPPADDEP